MSIVQFVVPAASMSWATEHYIRVEYRGRYTVAPLSPGRLRHQVSACQASSHYNHTQGGREENCNEQIEDFLKEFPRLGNDRNFEASLISSHVSH